MEKYTIEDIKKIYLQCGINPECKPKDGVQFTQIPNLLISDRNFNCDINTNKTSINRKL